MTWAAAFYAELNKLASENEDPELDKAELRKAREEKQERAEDNDPRNVRKRIKRKHRILAHNTREQDEVEKHEEPEDKGEGAHDEVED